MTKYCWTTASTLNVRNEPNVTGNILFTLPNKTKCEYLDTVQGWHKIKVNGRNGFVSGQYITFEDPSSEPVWITNAKKYIGLKEIAGSKHNPQILKWWELTKQPYKDDETAWCAAFVGGILEESGITSSRSAASRSYQKWGKTLDKPAVGAIVTFWRGSRDGWQGHVGFVVGKDSKGNIMVLGGNQENAVNIKPFAVSRVLSYTYPANHEPKSYELPVLSSDGKVSTNEA